MRPQGNKNPASQKLSCRVPVSCLTGRMVALASCLQFQSSLPQYNLVALKMNTKFTQRSSLLDGECVAEEISKSFQIYLRWRSEEIKVEKRHNVK